MAFINKHSKCQSVSVTKKKKIIIKINKNKNNKERCLLKHTLFRQCRGADNHSPTRQMQNEI
jgi:hypothetical protein